MPTNLDFLIYSCLARITPDSYRVIYHRQCVFSLQILTAYAGSEYRSGYARLYEFDWSVYARLYD